MNSSQLASYVMGFVLSIVLTFAAYFLVVYELFSYWTLTFSILGLAILQVLIQLLLFLHMGHEPKPRRNLLVFLFTTMVVVIIAGGSLWIMNNLNYNVMPQMDMHHQ